MVYGPFVININIVLAELYMPLQVGPRWWVVNVDDLEHNAGDKGSIPVTPFNVSRYLPKIGVSFTI